MPTIIKYDVRHGRTQLGKWRKQLAGQQRLLMGDTLSEWQRITTLNNIKRLNQRIAAHS